MARGGLRALAVAATAWAAASCNQIDTTRVAPPKATLGDDIYGVFCDRVGSSSIPEDLTGASYNSICHYDDKGQYGNTVDASALPPPATAAQKLARKLSVAKLERMAQRRGDLIRALNATFPDVKIADVTSKSGAQVRLHDALFDFAQRLGPLYETNPFDKKGEPLLPSTTRALSRLFDSFGAPGRCGDGAQSCDFSDTCGGQSCNDPSRGALSHMWGRRGYRPFQVGLGAIRPALAYPDLRSLTTSAISLLGPGGSASPELQQVLAVVKQEMLTAAPTVAGLPQLTIDPASAQPNRPRSDIEFTAALFLNQQDSYATGDPPRYLARRDRRGVAVPAGSQPGVKGSVQAPFVDVNGDGYADVDASGRFVDTLGSPLPLDPPFAIPGITTAAPDAFGRPGASASQYEYLDTSKTLLGALAGHLVPLLDPTKQTAPGDPDAWQKEHETLMYSLAGAYLLYGDREQATYDYSTEGAKGKQVTYNRFNPDTSPLPDLVHAAGQVLADPDSDAILLSLMDLVKNHEQVVARLLGAALKIRQIAADHDQLAAQGKEKKAELAYEVPIWDEMAKTVGEISETKGLLPALLEALADKTIVSPQVELPGLAHYTSDKPSQHMGETVARFMRMRDELTYDPNGSNYNDTSYGVNGPASNVTVDPQTFSDHSDPKTPVDQTKPKTGKNISILQRSLQLIHDANGGPACNKDGALVKAKLLGLTVTWPLIGAPYTECELFQFDNLAYFYVDSILPANHPKRSFLNIKSSALTGILSFLGAVGASPDDLFQQSSDIYGLSLHPDPWALNRLVFYGADSNFYPSLPDYDSLNSGGTTNTFVSNTIEPISLAECPPDSMNVPFCTDQKKTMRYKDPGTIFTWERNGFYGYLRPVVVAFANVDSGTTGERMFSDVIETLNRHWPDKDHGSECSATDPGLYCSGAGVNKYEPLLADAFESDIVPALHEFAKVATELSKITVQRGSKKGQVWTGAQVLEKVTQILFSKKYADSVGLADRKGKTTTTWVDGKTTTRVTGFTLFADALHEIDVRFDTSTDPDAAVRKGQWKRARSQLVDELMSVDGSGPSASFKNKSLSPMLLSLMGLLREQINANCPNRESTGQCQWARKDLGDKLAGVIGRPMFAAAMDLQEKLRADETSRRQLETFLQYALKNTTDGGQALQGFLASISDMLQVLADDGDMSPVLNAAAVGMNPSGDAEGRGAADTTLGVLKALTSDTYDRYHILDHVLPNLVTPMDDGSSLAPIEIFIDVIADINRIDASSQGPMETDDYQGVMSTMKGFMNDKTRGLEQLYTIIQNRPKQ